MSYCCDRQGWLWLVKLVRGQKINTRVIDAPRLQVRRRLYSSPSEYYITDNGQLYHAPTNQIINHDSLVFREVLKVDDFSQLVLEKDGAVYVHDDSLIQILDKVEFIGCVENSGKTNIVNFIALVNKEWMAITYRYGEYILTPIQGVDLPTGLVVDYRRNVLTIDRDGEDLHYKVRLYYGTNIEVQTHNRGKFELDCSIIISQVKVPSGAIDVLGPGLIASNTSVGYAFILTENGAICDADYNMEFKKRDGTAPWVDLHRGTESSKRWIGMTILDNMIVLYNQGGELYSVNMISNIDDKHVFKRVENYDNGMLLDCDTSKRIV